MSNTRQGATQLHTKVTPDLRQKIDHQLDEAHKYGSPDCPKTLQDFAVQALWYFLAYNITRLHELRQHREQTTAPPPTSQPTAQPGGILTKIGSK